MVVYYMFYKTKTLKIYRLKMSLTSLRLTLRNLSYMVKVGLSGFVGEIAVAVMMLTGNWMFKRYLGEHGVAAYSVSCYLFPLVYMIYNAVAASSQPIISFNHGAGEQKRVLHTLRFSLVVAIGMGLLMFLLMYCFAPTVVSCFLDTQAPAYQLAAEGLPYYSMGFLFMAVNICVVGYLQSVERAGLATLYTLMRGVVFLVATFIILPRLFGVMGLWLSVPVAEALTTLLIAVLVIKNKPAAQ